MIELKKFEVQDFNRLISWIDSKKLAIQFGGGFFDYPITHKQLKDYLSNKQRLIYKVIIKKTKNVIGHVELNNLDFINSNARICRVLIGEKSMRNKGLGKKIINEIEKIGFKDLKLHRLDLGVYDFNLAAINCYKKCGFEIEGLFKENTKVNNQYWSTYNMSKINTYD